MNNNDNTRITTPLEHNVQLKSIEERIKKLERIKNEAEMNFERSKRDLRQMKLEEIRWLETLLKNRLLRFKKEIVREIIPNGFLRSSQTKRLFYELSISPTGDLNYRHVELDSFENLNISETDSFDSMLNVDVVISALKNILKSLS